MGKAKELMPAAELLPRDGDVDLTPEQLAKISLFAGLKGSTDLAKFPGAVRCRHYHSGDAICRQGEAGWTAFYILTTADVDTVIHGEAPQAGRPAAAGKAGPVYRRSISDLVLLPEDAESDVCATIYLSIPLKAAAPQQNFLGRLFGKRTTSAVKARPKFIPIDAPTDVDGESLQAFLKAGDLFGEMSCLNRSPRSATIIAARDCFILEILRNIFEKVKEDANYKKKMEEEYKRRAMDQQIRNLPLFTDLSDEQIDVIRKRSTIKTYKAGQIICDEHDTSDDVYLIRSGLVKVVKGASTLLSPRDLADPPAVISALKAAAGPVAKLVSVFPPEVKAILDLPPNRVTAANERDIVQALNLSIKGPALWTDAAFKPIVDKPEFQERIKRLPADQKDSWMQRPDGRRLNRRLVEAAVPGLSPLPRAVEGVETILAYRARGELIGEMGLLRNLPRSASCVAYIHERDDEARKLAAKRDLEAVEMVHLPAALFTELLEDPRFARKVDSILAERLASDKQVMTGPVTAPLQSERFRELGLIQGQRLMLIDLDRCTRCDECVTACVNSHDDGRSRLFLDGPRFGNYLVPATCRSCLDPVCMIGCPVGSIHRGDNGQIVIEDWCIGCEMCARQCPYGSIQMHDTGIVREGSYEWQVRPLKKPELPDENSPFPTGRLAKGWRPIKAPVALDRDLLAGQSPAVAYVFRHEFTLTEGQLAEGDEFKVELTTPPTSQATVWVDAGRPLDPEEVKKDKRTYPVPDAARTLKPGRHVVIARVTPPPNHAGPIFDLRCDIVRRPKGQVSAADYVEKGVTELAVVCDLCSSLPGKVPSCVRACPHDAAMRVDARRNFPA
jgi:CRP-like cAMP-binding protein/Fe-S-cluster-containing hydrogenase component 2